MSTVLRERLLEAEDALDAIREGRVDAVVVEGERGHQVFRLEGPDQPFRIFVESMQEGALTLDAHGCVLYANPFLAQLLATPLEQVVGAPFARFVAPGYEFTVKALLQQGMASTVKGSCRLIAPGKDFPVQLTLSPLTHAEEPTCCVIVFDLREREATERAAEARVAAEQANSAKDHFLAMLSHELRSPLNIMLGWARILADRQDLPESARRAAATIERNARAQDRLIGDLLDISRVVAGKLTLEEVTVDLRALVEAALSGARMSIGQRDVALHCKLPSEEVYVWGDPTRLQQIVGNLLTNAVKFTDPSGQIHVVLRQDSESVELLVSDTGVGFEPDQAERIFEPFNQGAAHGGQRRGGLGLGLAVARHLVVAHGGSIRASSPGIGHGANFTVQLPRGAPPPSSQRPATELSGKLAALRILAVDDEPDCRELLDHLLAYAGATVVVVDSAAAALEALASGPFDVLLSDIGLPGQDGLALLGEIRARKVDIVPIALSGFARAEDAARAMAAGFVAHIPKPVDPLLLLETIATVVSRQAQK